MVILMIILSPGILIGVSFSCSYLILLLLGIDFDVIIVTVEIFDKRALHHFIHTGSFIWILTQHFLQELFKLLQGNGRVV